MTAPLDLAAIRGAHIARSEAYSAVELPDSCDYCRQDWPCDAAQLVAAFEAATERERQYEAALQIIAEDFGPVGGWDGWHEVTRLHDIARSALAADRAASVERPWTDDWRNPANIADSVAYTDAVDNER